nr:retrovirus-related Pol polyprotein from transposon TNT 1-94 [Tanacetum cinerariifolium]
MSYLSNFEEINGGYVAFGGNPKGGKITSKGKIRMCKLDFDDVYFVKKPKFNLFSVSQICDKKNSVLFTDTECIVLSSDFKLPDENHVLLRVPRENNMNNVDLKNIVPSGDLTFLWDERDKKEFSVARTPQQNGNAERKNRTLIEAARTMLADSLLPIPFWTEAVNTACFMRPFSCLVTILNTLDPLGKFDRKADEGFCVGYSEPESEVHVSPSSRAKTKKHDDKNKKEAKGKSPVELSIGFRNLREEFEYFSDNSTNEVNAASTPVPAVGFRRHSYSDGEEDVSAEADFSNLEKTITITTQTKSMTRMVKDHGGLTQRNNKDLHTYMFACFLKKNPNGYTKLLKILVRLKLCRRSFFNSRCKRHTQEEGIDYEEVFALVARIEAIRLFQAYASFIGFMVYVDDIIFGSTNKDLCKAFEKLMKDKFQISSMGELTFFLGLQTNNVVRLQALIDRRKVIITEDMVRQVLRLDDAESIDCLPNEEIFVELERMRTAWNEFSSSMASAVICLATAAQVGDLSSHTTKYTSPAFTQKVFANMRRVGKGFSRVDTPLFEGMLVPQQAHDNVADDVADDVTDDVTDDVADDVADVVADANAEPTPSSPIPATSPPPPPQQEVTSTPPPSPHQSPNAPPSSPSQQQPSQPSQQQPSQPSHTTNIYIDLLNTLLEAYTTLTMKVEALENIAELDADEDVTLEEVVAEVAEKDADAQGRLEESNRIRYYCQTITVAPITAATITAAHITAATIIAALNAAKRRKGVVIRDLKETATSLVIVHSEPKSKDKGKGILIKEPKPFKKQAQIEQDEAYARDLKAKLNANINWDDVIEQVKRKEKKDNAVLRYQALKRKPQTEAQARKNMMVYLKNMAGFKMDFFKGMSYDDIRPIFKKHFNSIVGFLKKSEQQLEEEASKALKRKSEISKQQAAKKHKLDEEVKELKKHLQIIPNNEDDVYTKATPLALKVPIVDYQIHTENNKPYYKIIRANGTHRLFLSFISLLRNFDREDLEMLWKIVQERFASSKPKNFSDDFLLNILKAMFAKPNVEAHIWKNQRGSYGLAKVKSWNLLESCGVHIIIFITTQMILLVERRYPLTRFTLDQMLNKVRLEVEKESEVSLMLLRFVRRKQQKGYRPE